MKKETPLLPLSELQLEEQLHSIMTFLEHVHPSLNGEEAFRPCIEVRPIYRGEKSSYSLKRSLNIWDLSPLSVERLRKFLQLHNGQPTCLFYSTYDFDNQKKATTGTGKSAKPGKITTESALGISEIPLDFDDITYEEFEKIASRFEELGIYPIWISSGHGFQAHILLEERTENKDVLRQCVYTFRSKGFACDPKCVDPARLMRLPDTFNCKGYSDSAYAEEKEDPPRCHILRDSVFRYRLSDILAKLDTLPTVSVEDEQEILPKAKAKKASKSSTVIKETNSSDEEEMLSLKKLEYPYLSHYAVPDAVAKMLAHTPHGYRNKVLGFLVGFFMKQYKLGQKATKEILDIWAEQACTPVYPADEYKKDFYRLYGNGGLPYDTSLSKQFGVIDFAEMVKLRKQDIMISRKFFLSFETLDGKCVRLYLAMKMLEHIKEEVTVPALMNILGISDRALRTTMQELLKSGHAYMIKGNNRKSIPNTYHTHRGYSPSEGYLRLSYNDVKVYVSELYGEKSRGNNELKLFLFMLWKFYSGDIFMSQERLGQHIGVARNTVCEIVSRLEEKHFLEIHKSRRNGSFFECCEYILLR